MNSAKTLYSLLNVILLLILLAVVFGFILSLLIFFDVIDGSMGLQPEFVNYKNEPLLYVFMGLMLVVYAVFISGLLKLRSATKLLLKKDFYNSALIEKLVFSGKTMVIAGVFSWVIDGLSGIYFEQAISISLSEKTFIYLFIIAMGLFLMLMGRVIDDAKTIKEENDLTI